MAARTGNDRSIKTVKFLEQYARLCVKHDRCLSNDGDGGLIVRNVTVNEQGVKDIEGYREE